MSQTFVKIMSAQNLPDDHHNKNYTLISLVGKSKIVFHQTPTPYLEIENEQFPVTGNVYVMNAQGKTISTFTPKNVPSSTDEPSEDKTEDKEEIVGAHLPANSHFTKLGKTIFVSEIGSGTTYASDCFAACDNRVSYLNIALKNIDNCNVLLDSISDPKSKLTPSTLVGGYEIPVIQLNYPKVYEFELIGLYNKDDIDVAPLASGGFDEYYITVDGSAFMCKLYKELPFDLPHLETHWIWLKVGKSVWLVDNLNKTCFLIPTDKDDIKHQLVKYPQAFGITGTISENEIGQALNGGYEYKGTPLTEAELSQFYILPKLDFEIGYGAFVLENDKLKLIAMMDHNRRPNKVVFFLHP